MATLARLSLSSSYSASIFSQNESISSYNFTYSHPLISIKTRVSSLKLQANDQSSYLVKNKDTLNCSEEYDKEIQFSPEKLVIAHFSATYYKHNSKIQRFMEEQFIRLSNHIKFLYVMANESEKTRQLCRREKIEKIPHFVFYKKTEKIHEVSGFQPEKLVNDVLYYVDDHPFSPVARLRSREDLEKLIEANRDKLIVLNVGKRKCVPCAKIYPSVLKLASQMGRGAVFARMDADESDSTMQMVREMDVVRVPAFLFFRNGEMCGEYVGSNMSALIRETEKLLAEYKGSDFPKQSTM
ncbi:hypothetical protein DH2020_047604 [Rehmannia glutinosa]|uniref:Thioredoxin domain-containing protein n=1 Tax=Rehmannia glutinosa TaxID=99300 RepID=A0ABR0U9P6_REHGL